MRKMLIIVLIIALLVGFGIMVISGVSIGELKMPSVEQIVSDNQELDVKIADLDNEIKNRYSSAQSELNNSFTKLKNSRQKYQDTINYSTEDEIKAANQTEKYELSFIWTKIGMYASKNKITMRADVSAGSATGLYNIAFTAVGEYLSISDFIYAIENDSKLGFKIDDFAVVPYSDEDGALQASFTVKNISIDKNSLTANGLVVNNNNNTTTNNNTKTNTNNNQRTDNDNQNTIIQ